MFLDGQSMFLAFLNYVCRWFNLWYHWTFSEIGKEVGQTGLHSGVVVCTPTLHGSKSQLGPFYADIPCSPGTCVGSSHGPKIYFIGSLVNLIEKWTWWTKKKRKKTWQSKVMCQFYLKCNKKIPLNKQEVVYLSTCILNLC